MVMWKVANRFIFRYVSKTQFLVQIEVKYTGKRFRLTKVRNLFIALILRTHTT